jgi:ABC-type glycerol-3-phosphate transport system permease component
MIHKTVQRPTKSRVGNILSIVMLAILGTFMALPIVYIVSTAFKPMDELFMFPPRFFVHNPTLNNFRSLSSVLGDSLVPISRYAFNTVFITAAATAGQLIVVSLAAYILEKRNFPGKNLLFSLVVVSLMFSTQVTAIPNYIIMSKIGWVDTYASLIIPAIASPLGLFLMKQFMTGIPDALLEAARIDGASELGIFRRIALPLVRPALLTLIIFAFQSMWGMTGGNYIFTEELKPLNYALNQIVNSGIARTGAAAAVSMLMLIPPFAVFIISQSSILETMASSGIKE